MVVKENVKSNIILTQNIQKILETIKMQNLWIVGIEEEERTQVKDIENTSNKIIEVNTLT